jgi:prepilin-type N-terminal cleavage/methylation domain-containing protein
MFRWHEGCLNSDMHFLKSAPQLASRPAFSLVELLVTMALIALLATLSMPALTSRNRTAGIHRAGYEISGLLEQARAHAMAHNTYTWVGFAPQADGTLTVGVVAARNGDAAPAVTDASAANSDVIALGKLYSLPQVSLCAPPPSSERPPARDEGQLDSVTAAIRPFSIGQGSRKVTFDKYVVQFNSRGETRISSRVQPLIEIGLCSTQDPANYAAVQIGGLSGSVTSYRP